MSGIEFVKMHGLGNDFIVFADLDARLSWAELSELARRHCPRRFAVGADGIIAITRPAEADYEMRYLNADGSLAEMCGNGIRCVGKYIAEELGETRADVTVLTGAGVLPINLQRVAGQVTQVSVSMGIPGLTATQIPSTLRDASEQIVDAVLEVGDERLFTTCVSMGNPHAVSFVESITDRHVLTLGPLIETHPAFPAKINAEFAQQLGPDRLRMRVWERGVGETMACGTGACAVVVAAVLTGRVEQGRDTTVVLNGGELSINWPGEGQAVQMTGPAAISYRGTLSA